MMIKERTQSKIHSNILSRDGFTFVEMMIAFAIFGLLIVVLYGTFFAQYRGFNYQQSMIKMNSDATIVMGDLRDVLDQYGQLAIGSDVVSSNGTVIIDVRDDGSNTGSMLNLSEGVLMDGEGYVIADHIDSIRFHLGPTVVSGYGVLDGVVLIVITMADKEASYVLKGGVNLVK